MTTLTLRRLRRSSASGSPQVLGQVLPGDSCRVDSYAEAVDERTARRLRDLGFAPGELVTVVRRAPMGDPVLFRVVDTVVALRAEHTRQIRVSTT